MPRTGAWLVWQPRVLSILRIVVGLLYLEHGLNKLFDFPPTPTHVPYHVASLVPGLAGPLEAVGGLLVALGLFTRQAAFILSGQMAIAYFLAHAPHSFFPLLNGGDAAILYCFLFFYFLSRAAAPGASTGCGPRGPEPGPQGSGSSRPALPARVI